ncbi:hypothetical protein [Aureispira anguillae]|uniref:Uncharacterized protein n=1 Tax=Aureispira anguillae TaxID=2864201 RepID=A0A915YFP2_9BACT|nr:hypothetical protein [Aureispira anguillae]BDS12287.1 hypothetical protein AsAng_0030060 [Aureispira anguillae]
MRPIHYILFFISLGIQPLVFGQNKTDIPSTFSEICFFTIEKATFGDFLKLKSAIGREEYGAVYTAIRKMRSSLKGFSPKAQNRAFELWYAGNYTNFDEQAIVAKEATLAALKNYEDRLRTREALYYDHRLFLEQYLAFTTEAFYPEYWFMSQERYFSRRVVTLIRKLNREEGYKLFTNSEFYYPFEIFNEMAETEEEEVRDYLDTDVPISDTTRFVRYSYMVLNKSTASYILQAFNLDDATQDIDLNREIRALRRFLSNVRSDKIYFVARFNHLEIQRMKEIEALKKREK